MKRLRCPAGGRTPISSPLSFQWKRILIFCFSSLSGNSLVHFLPPIRQARIGKTLLFLFSSFHCGREFNGNQKQPAVFFSHRTELRGCWLRFPKYPTRVSETLRRNSVIVVAAAAAAVVVGYEVDVPRAIDKKRRPGEERRGKKAENRKGIVA